MKVCKIKENNIENVIEFAHSHRNLVFVHEDSLSNEFKNVLRVFANSKAKNYKGISCYLLNDDKNKICGVIVLNEQDEILYLSFDEGKEIELGKILFKELFEKFPDFYKKSLTLRSKDNGIDLLNFMGFKSQSFINDGDITNNYQDYYFLLKFNPNSLINS